MNTDQSINREKLYLSRRNLVIIVTFTFLLTPLIFLAMKTFAAPNGTFPTMLSNMSITSVNSTQMRVQGRYITIGGRGIAGMRVDVYSVGEGSFSRWATTYTNGSGNFDITTAKPSAGRKLQVVIDGNGTYSQPFLTFNRP